MVEHGAQEVVNVIMVEDIQKEDGGDMENHKFVAGRRGKRVEDGLVLNLGWWKHLLSWFCINTRT